MVVKNNSSSFFGCLKKEFAVLVAENQIGQMKVQVRAKLLSPEDALGSTKRDDYVLLKGKERLMQAEALGCKGQAFTSALGDFDGTLEDVLTMPLTNDFQRAIYIATLNAVACHTGKTANTIHCRNEGPELCARRAADFFKKNYGQPRILMIGYQPALAEALNDAFPLIVLDLDPANIGVTKKGALIKDGTADLEESLAASDVIFSTGSVICNNSVDKYFNSGKPFILYGSTGAGAAALLDIPRYCPESGSGGGS